MEKAQGQKDSQQRRPSQPQQQKGSRQRSTPQRRQEPEEYSEDFDEES